MKDEDENNKKEQKDSVMNWRSHSQSEKKFTQCKDNKVVYKQGKDILWGLYSLKSRHAKSGKRLKLGSLPFYFYEFKKDIEGFGQNEYKEKSYIQGCMIYDIWWHWAF